MTATTAPVALSAIDEARFGVRIARVPLVTMDGLPAIMEFCRGQQVRMLIARCRAEDLAVAQALEQHGFGLMDTLVYYARELAKAPIPSDAGAIPVRLLRSGEEETVQRVAAEAFRDYFGHYHADPRLDRRRCDETYTSWAYNSCVSRDMADAVLVADLDGRILGFATMRRNSAEEGEGVLFGVTPAAQGRGLYRLLMICGMEWCRSNGLTCMVVSTQITNLAVQKVWVRLGFEPSHAYYTFHKWFDA